VTQCASVLARRSQCASAFQKEDILRISNIISTLSVISINVLPPLTSESGVTLSMLCVSEGKVPATSFVHSAKTKVLCPRQT